VDAPAIEARGLHKAYGERVVLDGIDFEVPAGKILGYIGPNGSGKSTTVRILCGLTPDYGGSVRVAGHDPREAPLAVKRAIGYVPENAVLYENLTVAEHLLFVGRMHALADELDMHRADELLAVFDLADRLGDRIATLSKGMRQKLLVTSALLHAPSVLVVDEPLSGLDVHAAILMKDLLRGLASEGRTVFYCSHVMDVVQRVCDEIAILHQGRIAARGTYEELAARTRETSLERVFAQLTGGEDSAERVDRALAALR
jgi:ABC-2 type transport system ATP-binding protein